MRPDALRPAPAAAAATATAKLATWLSKGEKRNRKRMAEVGNRLRRHPAVRGPTDILPASDEQHDPAPGPVTSGWWPAWSTTPPAWSGRSSPKRNASTPPTPGPGSLVEGNNHQINRITAEAKARDVPVAITVDLCRARDYADRRDLKCAKAL